MTIFIIIQHAEKVRTPGDPELTERDRNQADATGAFLRVAGISVVASPLRRARQTAEFLAGHLGLEVVIDDRLRERMNWDGPKSGQSAEGFLADWDRATRDRDFVPTNGDSSRVAGARFQCALGELSRHHDHAVVAIVAHGGLTIEFLRTLFGDRVLEDRHPGLVETGMPGCAITRIRAHRNGYEFVSLASVDHLDAATQSGFRRE